MGYVGAPYNFVSFSKDVYEYSSGKQLTHNAMVKEGLSGEITYEITAKTPIIIDNGKGEFYRNAEGKEAIPGSTMRGLIRSNVQILGLASMNEDVDDYLLMYRSVAGGKDDPNKDIYKRLLGEKTEYIWQGNKKKPVSVLQNVKAGYVRNEHGRYYIYQTEKIMSQTKAMNYYVLSERTIVEAYLKCPNKKRFEYDFCIDKDGNNILQHEFKPFERKVRNGRTHWIGKKNDKNEYKYKPYHIEVSYEVANKKDVVKVGHPGKYTKQGYAVSTGKMDEKKAVYIIPKIDERKPKKMISDADLKAFQIDINRRENALECREWFDLPKEGQMKPIFYIELGNRLYFGFTPRLRLFYEHGIKDGLTEAHKEGVLDYSTAMFGYSRGSKSFKSKLSFSDAVVQGYPKKLKPRRLIQAEPKPTSYKDYLCQNNGKLSTYNHSDFELRGVKQYWLHKQVEHEKNTESQQEFLKQFQPFSPLAEETKFAGKIRFQNLTEDELGLLLWSVRLNNGSQMNVGKAKAYGYGRIDVKITEAKVVDLEKAYATAGALVLNPYQTVDVDNMIACYKRTVNQFLKKRRIDDLPHIKEFFMMKDANHMPKPEDIRYMSIDAKEYQYRNNEPLPVVARVIRNK